MRLRLADQLIRAGECDVVVAGGMESMTQAPHLLPGSRSGYKYGNVTIIDHMAYDGLWDAFTDQAMGALTDTLQHAASNWSAAKIKMPSLRVPISARRLRPPVARWRKRSSRSASRSAAVTIW